MNTFLGSGDHGDIVLFGVPLDLTTSFRPGTRFGPAAIRAASDVLEDWSLALGKGLADVPFRDVGDIDLAPGDLEGSLAAIEKAARKIEGLPIALGGEHLITWPLVRVAASRHPNLHILQMDAHADLRDDYHGLRYSHATVMRRCAELLGPERIHQFGIRSAIEEEVRWAAALFPFDVLKPLHQVGDELGQAPVYVSIDIDVADPAFAPGTGTPEPGGIDARELLAAVAALRGLNVVAADVVEVAPAYDPGGITAALAAKVVRELILTVGAR
ncbi:MAG TPA: agmatinase [Bacillota bacterium]|nr:agmatinase [Bacillota bacterium]